MRKTTARAKDNRAVLNKKGVRGRRHISFISQPFLAAAIISYLVILAPTSADVFVDISNINLSGNGTSENPFHSITEGIEAASENETVKVAPGKYIESIEFGGKPITLISIAGPDVTCIETSNRVLPAVSYYDSEGPSALLSGFYIKGRLRGINIEGGAEPLISNCIVTAERTAIRIANPGPNPRIENVTIDGADDGIYIFSNIGTSPVIFGSRISNCRANGIWLHRSRATVVDTVFFDNERSVINSADGSGHIDIINCTFANNKRGFQNQGTGTVVNTIFYQNNLY